MSSSLSKLVDNSSKGFIIINVLIVNLILITCILLKTKNDNVFNNFGDMCIKEYELDPAHFSALSGLAWQACLKKSNIELELLTDYDMLLILEEGIRGGICHSIHRLLKLTRNT